MFTAHRYHSRAEFLADIELIAANCEQYNGSESRFTKNAKDLLHFARSQLEEVINGTLKMNLLQMYYFIKYSNSFPIIVVNLSKTSAKYKSVHVPMPNWTILGVAMIKTMISHTVRVVRVRRKMILSMLKVTSVLRLHQLH